MVSDRLKRSLRRRFGELVFERPSPTKCGKNIAVARLARLSESERAMSTHKHITSVTADSDFAYVQFDCGHVTVKRDGNRIILIPGPGCELASRGNLSMVEVTVSKITQRSQPRSWAWPARSRK
jgi:hypothetical protein